jgi:hypothetical protein
MRDWGGAPSMQHLLLLAEPLGLAMARRAADILEQHRHELTRPASGDFAADDAIPDAASPAPDARLAEDPQFAADDAIFTAVLDAAVDCLGRSDTGSADTGSADDRWCDALVHLLLLARLAPDAG